jgi:hypothetical protein
MKEVELPITSLYDVSFDSLLELKEAVDKAYEKRGNVKIRGDYVEFFEISYREKTPEEIECEKLTAKYEKENARRNWEIVAKKYGWKYE